MMKSQVQRFRRADAGFTLIELVIVITIIGVLATIALPKFTAIQTDARIAKLNASRASVTAGSAIIHSTYLTRAGVADLVTCPAGGGFATNMINGTICTEGGLVNITNGYPASSALGIPGIISAAGLSPSFFAPNLAQLNLEGIGAQTSPAVTTISVIGGSGTAGVTGGQTNPSCYFTYAPPVAAGAAPLISAVTTTGC